MGQSGRGLRGPTNEDGADDVKRQVDSDDNYQKPIYQLLNVKDGGGKLLDIIKARAKQHSSGSSCAFSQTTDAFSMNQRELDSAVDKQIYQLVKPFLYNEGHGKLVPLSRIWQLRFGKSSKQFGNADDDPNDCDENSRSQANRRYRWVCWKLEERGFVGETALHICFLLATPTHMLLAKKLLAMFPMLINDIYTCDEYFGESSLHLALVVSEDVRVVKILLDHGANVHERCLGSFFLPLDQKGDANQSIRSALERMAATRESGDGSDAANSGDPKKKRKNDGKWPSDPSPLDPSIDLESNHLNYMATNYDGYVYWGEYPLSFAACLGLVDCYKLLLAKGANPNRQDSNGNTTLHMTVIANRIDMFDLCFSYGANLSILNKQNLTPLTLAAKYGRVEMFFHILTIQRQVNWIFCNIGFVQIPLAGVDSIDVRDGSCSDNSVLSIVVFGGSNEHLQMLDGLLSQLLKIKWDTSVRSRFYLWLSQFLLFLVISSVAYITRFDRLQQDNEARSATALTEHSQPTATPPSSSHSPPINYRTINVYSEYVLVFYVIYYLWVTVWRIVPSGLGFRTFFRSLAQAPEMSLFTVTCVLILSCIPLRALNWRQSEDFLAALVMFTLPLKLLFFCRASRSVGSFVVMIYKIVVNDVLCFVVFLIIFVAGFSQSFLIMFKTHRPSLSAADSNATDASSKNYFTNLFDGIISMHMMAYNEFGIVFDEFNMTEYPGLAKVIFVIYMILVSILLINMLIAMLGKTYQDIASQPNENVRQWARALLIVERMWTKEERLQVLDRYSHDRSAAEQASGGAGGRYYGTTWSLTQKDRDKIESLKRLNAENRLNAIRLAKSEYQPVH